ncbi:benzoate/H(+) symporter BenE family transporter [Nocardia asteroides]|uniref:benzoate/H(+) symporter BenE family transporter n=1 Tax=Nocardia asteroides TaxID=1824 RepID=UPI0034274F40
MSQVTTTSPDEAAEARSGIGQPLGAGAITALVGFTSSFAVVLSGLRAVGASPAQAASGLMILCFTQGIGILLLSVRYRIPITLAWSTPGAALLASTGLVAGGWPGAVAAFAVTGVLIVITGLWQRLGSLVAAIPVPIAQAMLAGVLVPLCLAPVQALRTSPAVVVPVIVVWLVLQRFAPKWAVLVAFATAAIGTGIDIAVSHRHLELAAMVPTVELTAPQWHWHWHWQAIIGIAVPLYIVTMASQNIPGVAVMRSFDYQVPWRASMLVTGIGTIAGAAAGGHAINLAAISAALSAAPSASPDPRRRWIAAATAGGSYLILGLASAALVTLIAAAPAGTLETVAGLALLATLAAALTGALSDPEHRMAGLVTFLVAASGTTLFGIGGAFWALVAGLVVRRVIP